MKQSDATRVSPRWAFLLPWSFDQLGGVNGVLRNLLRQFETGRAMEPMAVEISGREAGPLSSDKPWPSVSWGALSSWDASRPWRSAVVLCLKAPALLSRLSALCRSSCIRVLNPHFIGMECLSLVLLRKLRLFDGLVILSFHGSDIREMMQSRGMQRNMFRLLLRGADYLVACSDGLREEILDFVPECAGRALTIHNGIDVAAFESASDVQLPLPASISGKRIVLNIGAFEYKKGHDVLLRAFCRVRTEHPQTLLVIAGQRSSAELRRLGQELGLEDDLILLENIPHEQVAALLKRADVFALSSRWEKGICGEGFAMALLEAGALARPVVTTRSCGTTELIDDGVTGRIVPTEDPAALAEAICDLLADPVRAEQMASRLRERVARDFTWKIACEKYLRLAKES